MSETTLLLEVLIFLGAAIVTVALFRRLRITPLLGYLTAGVLIGPHVLGLLQESPETELLAEFGVIFLLFAIGLELPIGRLKTMRRHIFGLGLAQVAITSAVIGLIAYFAGIGNAPVALLLGGALALSSTATVLQLLVERNEAASRHGRVAIGVLLFQDLAVVPLLALVPLLGPASGGLLEALALAGAKALAAVAAILIIGRLLLRRLLAVVARARVAELFTATCLLIVLATGMATAAAGMSMALGAFLAGLVLADSEYRHQVEADIQPFRGLFLGLFFITVGMAIDLPLVGAQAGLVIGLCLALILGKAAIIVALALLYRQPLSLAVRVGLMLAQGGEFAFVLLALGIHEGVLASEVAQPAAAAVALSMILTPGLAWLGGLADEALERQRAPTGDLAEDAQDLRDHVLIAGFGRVGRIVAHIMESHNLPYLALDLDVRRVEQARRRGLPVYYGDASRLDVLLAAGAQRARLAVVTLDQAVPAERAVTLLRQHCPNIAVVVRGRDSAHRIRLEQAGATHVVPEVVEASLQLGAASLRLAGTGPEAIDASLSELRRDDYARLKELLEEALEGELESPNPGSSVSRGSAQSQ